MTATTSRRPNNAVPWHARDTPPLGPDTQGVHALWQAQAAANMFSGVLDRKQILKFTHQELEDVVYMARLIRDLVTEASEALSHHFGED